MKVFEIYWRDLTDEAKERLKELYHDNIDNNPIATIDVCDDEPELKAVDVMAAIGKICKQYNDNITKTKG